jgi:hypothetical protein
MKIQSLIWIPLLALARTFWLSRDEMRAMFEVALDEALQPFTDKMALPLSREEEGQC